MNNVTIEVLKDKDIKEYSELLVKVMEEFNQVDINDFQYWFTSIEGIICRRESDESDEKIDTVQFAAKCNGKIIGAMEVENQSRIQLFFIKKEFQNKGIGRLMFNNSINFFRKKGIRISYYNVLSSTYAVNIYKSLGFTNDGSGVENCLTFKNALMPFELVDIFYLFGKKIRKMGFHCKSTINKMKVKLIGIIIKCGIGTSQAYPENCVIDQKMVLLYPGRDYSHFYRRRYYGLGKKKKRQGEGYYLPVA